MEELGPKVAHLLEELEPFALNAGHGAAKSDLSLITNYTVFLLIALVLCLMFFVVASRRTSLVPSGIGNLAEAGVEFVKNSIVLDVLGHHGLKYVPLVVTVFFAILFNNFLGLIPGFKGGTGSLGVTFTWGLIVFIWVNAVGFKVNGLAYIKSFLPSGTPKPLAPFIFLLELISHFLRPVTLGVRLYANMYAGHIVLGVFAIFVEIALKNLGPVTLVTGSLSMLMQIVMYGFEVFVAFIQAYVFAILTAVYIGSALHASEH